MNLTSVFAWLKENKLIAAGIALAAIFLFFPKVLKSIFGGATRRRRRPVRHVSTHRSRVHRAITGRSRPVRRTTMRRSKGAKKPWQIKGSLAAKRRMALIRKRR
jgi:hypothetical protein